MSCRQWETTIPNANNDVRRGSVWNYSHYTFYWFLTIYFFSKRFCSKATNILKRHVRSTKSNHLKKKKKTIWNVGRHWTYRQNKRSHLKRWISRNFSFTGLQSRGSGGEELRTTAETCAGGDTIRIATLQSPGLPQTPSARGQQQQQHYDPEYAKIEAWLDEHREFTYDYFIR